MEPAKAVKEYKDQVVSLNAKIDEYAKVVGKITVERDWAVGKLQSLDLSNLSSTTTNLNNPLIHSR